MEKMRQNVSKFRSIPTQKGQGFQQFRTEQRQKEIFSVRNASEDDAFAAPPGRKMLFEKLSDFKISFCRAEIKSPLVRRQTRAARFPAYRRQIQLFPPQKITHVCNGLFIFICYTESANFTQARRNHAQPRSAPGPVHPF